MKGSGAVLASVRRLVLVRAGRRAVLVAIALVGCGTALAASAALAGGWPSSTADAICSSISDVGQTGVSADSASDAWAIGGCNGENVVEHWDGRDWTLAPFTAVRQGMVLTGVAAISPANVWVVGYDPNGYRPFVEHWNGSRWTTVGASGFAGATHMSQLNAVAATSSGGTWAVGIVCCPRGLIEHWNGSRMAASPDRALPRIAQSVFNGVAATSPRDVWVVGNSNARGFHALAEHWDGRRWRAVKAPRAYELSGVAATSPANAWAVGSASSQNSGGGVVEHWNGKAWSAQASAALPLYAVSASSPTNAWAVGFSAGRGVIEHWDGLRWSVQAKPPVELQSVVAVSANDAWALGGETLMHWDGHAWGQSG